MQEGSAAAMRVLNWNLRWRYRPPELSSGSKVKYTIARRRTAT